MKKLVIVGVILVVAANAGTIWYVNHQMLGMQKTVSDLKSLAIKLPPEFEDKLKGDLSSIIAGVRSSTDKTIAEMSPSVRSAIIGANSNLVEMCRSKVLGNEVEAELSYQKAVQALQDGDVSLAKLYCMNAINHSPTKKLYFEKLVEISDKAGEETRDDLEQIKSALELGLFQVASADVPTMRDVLASVMEKIGNLDANAISARQEDEKLTIDETLKLLRGGELCYESVIATSGVARVALLQRRLVSLQELNKDSLASNDVAWVEEQNAKTRASLEYYGLVDSADGYLTRAEKLLGSDSSKLGAVNLMVQTASQSLSQALGLDPAVLPILAAEELQSLTKRIEAIELRFNKIKSESVAVEVRALIAKVDSIEVDAPYQGKIESIDASLAEITQKLGAVYDVDMRNSLEREIKIVSAKLGQCRQAQYKAYQSWAIDRCDAGMKKYRSWHRVDIVDAEYVVYNYLVDIDSTLLSPDVTRLYQDVLGKQFAELKDHTVKVEIDLAKHKKRQLSDF